MAYCNFLFTIINKIITRVNIFKLRYPFYVLLYIYIYIYIYYHRLSYVLLRINDVTDVFSNRVEVTVFGRGWDVRDLLLLNLSALTNRTASLDHVGIWRRARETENTRDVRRYQLRWIGYDCL